jgi:hypothetical protein
MTHRARPHHTRLYLFILCLGALAYAACDTRPKETQARGPGVPTIDVGQQQPGQPGAAQAAAPGNTAAQGSVLTGAPGAAAAAAKKDGGAKRDFAAELRGQMADAPTCLAPRPSDSAPRSLDINVTAIVTPSGAVSRGTAECAPLNSQELACLRQRVETTHFNPPFDDAPFTITATIHVDQQPQPKGGVEAAVHRAPGDYTGIDPGSLSPDALQGGPQTPQPTPVPGPGGASSGSTAAAPSGGSQPAQQDRSPDSLQQKPAAAAGPSQPERSERPPPSGAPSAPPAAAPPQEPAFNPYAPPPPLQ